MSRNLLCLALSLSLPAIAGASTISVKFLDSNDTAWTASAVVGAPGYAQANWNLVTTDWSGNAPNDALFTAGLKDSAGTTVSGGSASPAILGNVSYAPHADPLHFDAANTWRSGAGNSTPNHTLMNGYLDDGTDNQPYVNLSLNTNAGLFETYTIVLYVNGDAPSSASGRYWIESWTDSLTPGTPITQQVGVAATAAFSGTFTSAGSFAAGTTGNFDAPAGNYLVFTGLTDRKVRIRSAGNGDPEDFGRGPLNGFQIIDTTVVPEPGSAVLGAFAAAVLLRRRRR